jgi:integrase
VAKNGYAYRKCDTLKEAREFRESGETKIISARSGGGHIITVADGLHKWLEVCEKEGRAGGAIPLRRSRSRDRI